MMNKITVEPEGRKNIWVAEKESLKKWIKEKEFKQIHNFKAGGQIIIGADHEVESVFEDIDNAERIAVFTDEDENMGHSLAIVIDNQLECFDVGVITKKDLSIKKNDE